MSNQHTYSVPFTADQLRTDYHDYGMSQVEIASKWGTTQKVVWTAMKKFGIKSRKAFKRNQEGEANDSWKGDSAGYAALHYRVRKAFGTPTKCDVCGTTDPKRTYDWANLSGRYHDVRDYLRMCRSCHWKHDGTINNIKHMRKEQSK